MDIWFPLVGYARNNILLHSKARRRHGYLLHFLLWFKAFSSRDILFCTNLFKFNILVLLCTIFV